MLWEPRATGEIDAQEANCLYQLFGERLGSIPAVSLKGAIGNPLAAAGSIQVASTALSLSTGRDPADGELGDAGSRVPDET